MSLVIADQHVVTFHYTLKNDDGDVIDSSEGGEPLAYLHGAHNIVSGLESAMLGKSVGDTFEVTVPPEDGYGLRHGPGPQPLPRSAFPPGTELVKGMNFHVEDDDGNVLPVWVTAVEEDVIYIDANHPMAGETPILPSRSPKFGLLKRMRLHTGIPMAQAAISIDSNENTDT